MPPAVETQSPNSWTAWEVLDSAALDALGRRAECWVLSEGHPFLAPTTPFMGASLSGVTCSESCDLSTRP